MRSYRQVQPLEVVHADHFDLSRLDHHYLEFELRVSVAINRLNNPFGSGAWKVFPQPWGFQSEGELNRKLDRRYPHKLHDKYRIEKVVKAVICASAQIRIQFRS